MDALVSTEWLERELGASDLRVVDATKFMAGTDRDARAEYTAAHIPGARFFDLDEISDPRSSLPHMAPPPEKFISRMRAAQSARKVRQGGNDLSSCKDFQAVAKRDSTLKRRKGRKVSFADKALSKAWDEAMRLAPCAQLDAAREACAQFMCASASAKVLDVEVIDYTVFIRRQVPGVVRETIELVALLEPPERERAISNLIGDLIAVGKGARLQLDRLAKPLRGLLPV